jgi:hypothetical protein
MTRYTIKVLPPRKKNIKISTIFANGNLCIDFNRVKRFVKVNKEDNLLFAFCFMNMDNMHNVKLDYPNLYIEVFLYEEQTKDYTRKFLKLKRNSFIIKPRMFKQDEIKVKVLLRDEGKVIDYCLIDIV